jgi:hypothetical protein
VLPENPWGSDLALRMRRPLAGFAIGGQLGRRQTWRNRAVVPRASSKRVGPIARECV